MPRAQVVCIHKLAKIVVICKSKDLMLATFQIMAPSFESFNDYQKLVVIGLILSFD